MSNKGLTTRQLIQLLQVRGLGRAKVLKLAEMVDFKPSTDYELADFVLDQAVALRLSSLTHKDIIDGFQKAGELLETSERLGIRAFSYLDQQYPGQLREIPDFPIALYVKGNLENLLDKPAVAVIGTREPTEYGRSVAERIGSTLGEAGIDVVSGLAKGCDTAAHVGSLKAGGMTTAVLAHGLDSVYPGENRGLAEKILETGGCLVSEYIVKTRPIGNFFVERDRIQAGLSKATVVVETDIKGGTMHTVKYTETYGRILTVFNHPPNRQTDKSRGNQWILAQGKAMSLQTKEQIDQLIEMVNPDVHLVFSTSSIPIAEINLPLYRESEWNSLVRPREEQTDQPRPKKKKRAKPDVTQLLMSEELAPVKKVRPAKEKKPSIKKAKLVETPEGETQMQAENPAEKIKKSRKKKDKTPPADETNI